MVTNPTAGRIIAFQGRDKLDFGRSPVLRSLNPALHGHAGDGRPQQACGPPEVVCDVSGNLSGVRHRDGIRSA